MPNKLTLEVFQSTPEYRACRRQSQVWLTAFATNGGDYVQATISAYPTRNTREKARVFSHAVRNWPKIVAALNLYFGRSPVDVAQTRRKKSIKQLVRLVKAQLAEAELGSVAAQRLLAQLQSLLLDTKTGLPDPESKTESASGSVSRVPPGCRPVRDKAGILQGYLDLGGKFVPLAPVEVAQ